MCCWRASAACSGGTSGTERPPGTYELIGGGAFLAAAMQGPLAGVVLVVELTGHFDPLIVPTVVAVVEATVLSRKFGAASIYSARIGQRADDSDARAHQG